ncbi:lipopolysaccharide heptosyltransferase II [Thermostilla marina]
MNIATMRRLDRWLGGVGCRVLTAWRKLVDHRSLPEVPSRILFVKPAEQGATVLAERAVAEAARRVGRENVFFLVFAENRFVIDAMQLVPPENVLTLDTRGLLRFAASVLHFMRAARRLKIDTAIDLEFFTRASAILTYLSGARSRVGLHPTGDESNYRGDLMTHRVSYNPRLHTSQMYEAMVRALDVSPSRLPAFDWTPPPPEPPQARFEPAARQTETVAELLAGLFPGWSPSAEGGNRLVLLNANASDLLPLRRWEPDRYVTLAKRLLAWNAQLRVVFTGGPSEAEAGKHLADAVDDPRCASAAGKTSLDDLLTLYHFADVLVTNDSGPAHFACLTPVDVVVLFGPETPKLFGAVGPRVHILYAKTACSPCVNAYNHRTTRCRLPVCMERITVDAVFDAVVAALDRRMHG